MWLENISIESEDSYLEDESDSTHLLAINQLESLNKL